MQKHSYQISYIDIFFKGIFTWILFSIQLIASIALLSEYNQHTFIGFFIINLGLSSFSIPGLMLHLNYLKYAKKRKLIITYDSITLEHNEQKITINNSEICKIKLHDGPNTKSPWDGYQWFELIDIHGQKIIVNSYLLEMQDFWQDRLTGKISSKILERSWKMMPFIKND